MRIRSVRIALAVLLLGSLLAYRLYRMHSRTQAYPKLETKVVIAMHDLQMEWRIKDDDLQVASRPGILLTACHLDQAQVLGKKVVMPVQKGDAICLSNLAAADEETNFTAPGMRAVWIPVTKTAGADSVQRGMHVDVLAGGTARIRGEAQTQALLHNILVLAVGKETPVYIAGESLISVALLVSPDDARKLVAASLHARILLSRTSTPSTLLFVGQYELTAGRG